MTRIDAPWLTCAPTQRLFDIAETAGIELFCVGGCVRNALLDVPVEDVDMASDAAPDVLQAQLEASSIKVVPTGLAHGTITAVVDQMAFEITTFREDVSTDGRHAIVAYSRDITADARRRDFTINALYANRLGDVIDPIGGLADIAARRVRFIDDAQARIREDYLRILRFFRFHGRFAKHPPDADTMDAIARNIDGLQRLSAERITAELLKILCLADPAPTIGATHQCGVLAAVLPGSDPALLAPTVHVQQTLDLTPDPIARLAAIAGPDTVALLRLSNAQSTTLTAYQTAMVMAETVAALGHTLGADGALHVVSLRSALASQPPPPDARSEAERGARARFPVVAADLMPQYTGAALGSRLRALKSLWLASNLTLDKDALLLLQND